MDISKNALEVAKENAKLNNVNIEFIKADIFQYKSDKKYDIIVSNPPYVTESEKSLMKKNVLNFEPELALFVDDENNLKYYDSILNFSQLCLKKIGFLYFEINENSKTEMIIFLKNNRYQNIEVISDTKGKNRFIKCSK